MAGATGSIPVAPTIPNYQYFQELTARVDCAQSGLDGAKRLQAYRSGLALIDFTLADLTRPQRADLAANEAIPALLTSGHRDAFDRLEEFRFPHLGSRSILTR